MSLCILLLLRMDRFGHIHDDQCGKSGMRKPLVASASICRRCTGSFGLGPAISNAEHKNECDVSETFQ
jgi:hypothetical protein